MAARIMILAGGTGGHIYPALAVAQELLKRGCEVRWMGTKAGMEARIVPNAGIEIDWLSVSGFRGKGLLSKLLAPFQLIRAFWQSFRLLSRFKPDVVLGMGGFVAGPGGLMAWLMRIPLVVHEQNRIPGTTNKILVRFAESLLEAFPDSFKPESAALCVGNPLRKQMIESSPRIKGEGKPLKVLVLGGSQGAKALNQIVPHAFAGLNVEVHHQSGLALHAETQALYEALGVKAQVSAFIEDMASSYAWADLAICRAGAMTVSELMAQGLPAILVPFPFAIDDHQTANALYLVDAGAAFLMPQSELKAESLSVLLSELLRDPKRFKEMSGRLKSLARLNAAETVADICISKVAR